MLRALRVLLIGCSPDFVPEKLCGCKVEIAGGNDDLESVESMRLFQVGQEDQLSKLTEADYDYIVIGNNLGSGAQKASYVPSRLRSRVVIVWNGDPTSVEISGYSFYGFEHFSSRFYLGQELQRLCESQGLRSCEV